jgi:hypothetical protein
MARAPLASILWLRGFPDQAVRESQTVVVDVQEAKIALGICNVLVQAACPIALYVGDMTEAERSIGMLLDCSAKTALNTWNAVGRCFQGRLLLAQGDPAGLPILRAALDWLREAQFVLHYTISLGALAEGLAAAGQFAEAHRAIDEALGLTERNEEFWCVAELLRIKGEVIRKDGLPDASEAAEH